MKKIKGKLLEDCYVGGKLCKKKEEVEVREDLAESLLEKKAKKAPKPAAKSKK